MSEAFFYTFPAIRGIQAGQEYYISMCPMNIIPKIFLFDEHELAPELRAQRVLNKARIPAMCNYILDNPNEYVFSALTASIDADIDFIPISDKPTYYNVGHIRIPMSARFVINDGQHRRAAIEEALKKRPELASETIACVFFADTGLRRSQQMFADLNRYAIRPTRSLSILYDYRDPLSQISRELVQLVPIFTDMTELDKTTISNRSPNLFTLSGIHRATEELLRDFNVDNYSGMIDVASSYWLLVSSNIQEWSLAKTGQLSACDLRKNYIHAHTVALVALGRVGRTLLIERPSDWQKSLEQLSQIDWRRSNSAIWEGRATVGGKVGISSGNVTLLTNVIKKYLELPLTDEEQQAEEAFNHNR